MRVHGRTVVAIDSRNARMKPTPHPAVAAAADTESLLPAQAALLEQLASLLGMPASEGARLAAPALINGPVGLACRLHLRPGAAAVRPEVLLPLRADEFSGAALERLLRVQALLLGEVGWYLGMSSPERMLSVTPMDWTDDAASAATALDLANGIGVAAIRALIDAEAGEVGETGEAVARQSQPW